MSSDKEFVQHQCKVIRAGRVKFSKTLPQFFGKAFFPTSVIVYFGTKHLMFRMIQSVCKASIAKKEFAKNGEYFENELEF